MAVTKKMLRIHLNSHQKSYGCKLKLKFRHKANLDQFGFIPDCTGKVSLFDIIKKC